MPVRRHCSLPPASSPATPRPDSLAPVLAGLPAARRRAPRAVGPTLGSRIMERDSSATTTTTTTAGDDGNHHRHHHRCLDLAYGVRHRGARDATLGDLLRPPPRRAALVLLTRPPTRSSGTSRPSSTARSRDRSSRSGPGSALGKRVLGKRPRNLLHCSVSTPRSTSGAATVPVRGLSSPGSRPTHDLAERGLGDVEMTAWPGPARGARARSRRPPPTPCPPAAAHRAVRGPPAAHRPARGRSG